MLRSLKDLERYAVSATAGDLGRYGDYGYSYYWAHPGLRASTTIRHPVDWLGDDRPRDGAPPRPSTSHAG